MNYVIADGDFQLGNPTAQNQKLILLANKGEIRSNPGTGIGIVDRVLDDNVRGLSGQIKREFERDGMSVEKIIIKNDNTINVEAEYANL
jgi:hypothetical protein